MNYQHAILDKFSIAFLHLVHGETGCYFSFIVLSMYWGLDSTVTILS